MDKKLTLYYFPGSYFSCKALLALYEKGLKFDEVFVNIRGGEQRSDWFLKVNPRGEVPALVHGDKVIIDSERIIDYVDKEFSKDPKLVPDVTSPIWNEVAELRTLLNGIKIDHITYGVFANENLRVGEIKVPGWVKKLLRTVSKDALAKEYNASIKELTEKLEQRPDIASELKWKIKDLEEKRDVVLSEEKTSMALDGLEPIFDRLERNLEQSKKENADQDEYWLTGKDLTAADITTAVLLFRMWFIGMDIRYFTEEKRPQVYAYYLRLQKRQSFKKIEQEFSRSYFYVLKAAVVPLAKTLVKAVVVVGLIGLVGFAVREISRK